MRVQRGTRILPLAVVLLLVSTATTSAQATAVPADHLHAVSVDPPGESGFIDAASLAQVTAGTSTSYGPHFDDQQPLYDAWQYKPFQFERTGTGVQPGGRTDVTVYRDGYGVPQVYGNDESSLFYGFGWAMAHDRLFQMEAFRRVGHGTLGEITGESSVKAYDEPVRRYSEGTTRRLAEFAKAGQDVKTRTQAFVDGVNQAIVDQCGPMIAGTSYGLALPTCPAEFAAVNDPVTAWTIDDVLGFDEYAGRFFGEFGHTEVTAAKVYSDMVTKLGQPAAEKAFNDIYRLQNLDAPTTVDPADGLFPRHVGKPVQTSFAGSIYANHDLGVIGSGKALAAVAAAIALDSQAVGAGRQALGLERLGSNGFVVDGTRTKSGNPILYGGPQTGLSAPGTFWEVELHDPIRDERGVTIPDVPLIPIGRNADSAWTVTSGLDANSDAFVEQLDNTDTHYLNHGKWLPVQTRTETIKCTDPPTNFPGFVTGTKTPCPVMPETVTEYTTIHGAGITDPVEHRLYVRASSVDDRLIQSLDAWDQLGRQHTAADMIRVLERFDACWNFLWVDTHGEVAYQHTGLFPIHPSNADPNLPLPGTGAYDWRAFENYADVPHVINPRAGFMVTWNNKPAKLWYSKASDSTLNPEVTPDNWGPGNQVEPLATALAGSRLLTLDSAGQVPRKVAYLDNRAHYLKPYLVSALKNSPDAKLRSLAAYLQAWDNQRSGTGSPAMMRTAPVFFDRWLEHFQQDLLSPVLGSDYDTIASLSSASNFHYVSTDNEDILAHKYELATLQTMLLALRGNAGYDFFAGGSPTDAIRTAAAEAVTELGGGDPAGWSQPVEHGVYKSQGAGGTPDTVPLPNRGSFGEVVEPVVSHTAASASPSPTPPAPVASGGTHLPPTSTGGPLLPLLMLVGAAALLLARVSHRAP